jgi:hypothetical protein
MKPWFGERWFVPGFPRPITWQGWVDVLALVGAIVYDARYIGIATTLGIVVIVVAFICYVAVAMVTSGKSSSWGIFKQRQTSLF